MAFTANWSYPTAIKFGTGRISELAQHCNAAGMKRPLLVTDKALSALPITAQALDVLFRGGPEPDRGQHDRRSGRLPRGRA